LCPIGSHSHRIPCSGLGFLPLKAHRLRFLPRPRVIFRGMEYWANSAAICRSYRAAVPRS